MNRKAQLKPKKTYTAIVYRADGTQERFEEPKSFFTLAWLQEQVGGRIEHAVVTSKGMTLVINECSRVDGSSMNFQLATELPDIFKVHGDFFGDVVYLPTQLV